MVPSLGYTNEEKIETVYTAWECRARASDTVRELRVAQQEEVLGGSRKPGRPPASLSPRQDSRAPTRAVLFHIQTPTSSISITLELVQKSTFLNLTSELFNQKFWEWAPAIWFNKPPKWF